MNKESKVYNTTCPLCLYGCRLSVNKINQGDLISHKIEYDSQSSINQGRLCTRGNTSTKIIEHNKRLSSPLLNNKDVNWQDAIRQITSQLKMFSPQEVAITYDTNNTLEELGLIYNFAHDLNVDLVARSYLEPESFFSYAPSETKYASLNDIEHSQAFLVIGDIFNKIPLISKPILDAKYSDRNNRLFYIDSVKTRIAGFSNNSYIVHPNTEPLLLLGLLAKIGKPAKEIIGEKNWNKIRKALPLISEICGILENDIEELAQSFIAFSKGVVLTAVDYGKTADPLLLTYLSQLLSVAAQGNVKFCPVAQTSIPMSKNRFGTILDQINQGKTKVIINFGDLFPFYYSGITAQLKNLKSFVTTTTFRNYLPIQSMILPVPLVLEKSGTINTLWGKDTVNPLAEPISGSKLISDIISSISPNTDLKAKSKGFIKPALNIDDIIERALHLVENKKDTMEGEFTILGEEQIFGYRNIFENDTNRLKINLTTAQKLGVQHDESIKLIIRNSEKDFITCITASIPNNTASISVNSLENRGLFPVQVDSLTKDIIISSTFGKLKI